MSGKLFRKYYSRLAREGVMKSLLCGAIVGFGVLFVSAAASWLVNTKLYWVAILLSVAIAAFASLIFYHKKFKPTTRQIASRVDELGLEERILTMTELEGDESYIAMRQREDALAALQTVNEKLLTIIVSVPLVVATCISGVFGVGMTTITVMSDKGIIKSGGDLIDEATAIPPKEFELSYEADERGGMIEGEQFQIVVEGQSGTAVMAVAEEGWAFLEWSDGYTDPYRIDENVTDNITVIAYFSELQDMGDGGGDGGDKPGDIPQDPGQGGSSKPGQGPGAGGEYTPSNQVIDGQTYYGHEYGLAFEETLEKMAQNTEMPDELRQLITNYFETIKVESNEETEDSE